MLKLNIKARQDTSEFLTANLLSIHIITLDIDCSWNFLSSHNFARCSSSSSSTSEKRALRTWNLGQVFEIELSMVGQQHSKWLFWVADCSKILKSKIKARPVNAGLYLAFKHCISFVAANFGWQWLQFIQNHVRHCFQVVGTVLWKCCAIWLESEQTPFSWKGRPFSLRSAALSRIQFRTCWYVLMFFFY